jgi:hypothetical protein
VSAARGGLLALVLAGVLLGVACSASDQGVGNASNSSGLSDYLPDQPGNGLPGNVNTQQVLDVTEASRALPTGAALTAQQLAADRYRSGFARVWGTPTQYATMVVLALGSTASAQAFLEFERTTLSAASNTYTTAHASIPGSFVFVISSPTQASGSDNSEICNGVWFSYQAFAFESLACGTTPDWATAIEAAAYSLYSRAKARAG